jgi:hypothetical protein
MTRFDGTVVASSDAAIQGPPPRPTEPLDRFARDDGVGSIAGRTIPALRIGRLAPAPKMKGIEPLRTLGLPAAVSDFGRERTRFAGGRAR